MPPFTTSNAMHGRVCLQYHMQSTIEPAHLPPKRPIQQRAALNRAACIDEAVYSVKRLFTTSHGCLQCHTRDASRRISGSAHLLSKH